MAGSQHTTEIERKFLVSALPDGWQDRPRKRIQQGYLCGDGPGVHVRLRRMDDLLFLTIKGGKGTERTEVEMPLDPDPFERLWPFTEGRRLEKTRYYVPLQSDLTAELDLFGGVLDGLRLVEVEFASRNDADAFLPPDWFGREVTDDGSYTNAALSARTAPPLT